MRRAASEMASQTESSASRSKRSQTVTLVLLAGAGATALALTQVDPSQREEDVLVYPTPEACTAGRVRTEADCRRDYATALAAYPDSAPRYGTLTGCEAHHGANRCLNGAVVAASDTGQFVPIMAAFLLGRRPEQELTPQPVYDHRPEEAARGFVGSGGGGGYCTGWGGRVVTSSGGTASSARVASSAVRRASFGGFGGTGRGFSAHGSGSSHGSGG